MSEEYTEFEDVPKEHQPHRDPVLDLVVNLTLKVEDVNVLLAKLAKLPFEEVANIIVTIRKEVLDQVTEKMAENKTAE